ncbi:MAG: UMP kinase, partial [Deltaproteobacteria bacterium]|nr:UMP kinase [Deltaproteobacteria bacterium]
ADPVTHREAKRFDHLSYLEVLQRGLKVMDATAISLCMDHRMPIVVFDVFAKGNLRRVVGGEPLGTTVREG